MDVAFRDSYSDDSSVALVESYATIDIDLADKASYIKSGVKVVACLLMR